MYFGQVRFGAAMQETDKVPSGGESGVGKSTGAQGQAGSQADVVADRRVAQQQAAATTSRAKAVIMANARTAKLRSTDIVALQNELAKTEAALAAKRAARAKRGLSVKQQDLLDAEIYALQLQRDSLIAQIAQVQAQIDKDAAEKLKQVAYTAHLVASRSGGGGGGGGSTVTLGTGSTGPSGSTSASTGNTGGADPYVQPFPPPAAGGGGGSSGGGSSGGSASLTDAQIAAQAAKEASQREWQARQAALQAQAEAEAAAAALAEKQAAAEAEAQAQIDDAKDAEAKAAAEAELERLKAESIAKSSGGGGPLLLGLGLAIKFFFF